jgi:putative transposase
MDDRKAFTAIMYVLRTGIRWGALPREMGASSTVHSRFLEWLRGGLFKAIYDAGLTENADLSGINWDWQRTTAITTHVPFRRASARQVIPGRPGSGTQPARPMESKAAQSY